MLGRGIETGLQITPPHDLFRTMCCAAKEFRSLGAVAAFLLMALLPGCRQEGAPAISVVEPFSLVNGNTRWASLNAAVAAAEPGETILIDQDGEVPYAPFVTTVPLRLQAAPERRPVLVSTADDTSFIRAEAPLALEGLTLMQHILERERCPSLIEARGPLRVTNCRLGRLWKGPDRLLSQDPVIRCSGRSIEIVNSELYAPSSNLLFAGDPSQQDQAMILRNNAITAAFACHLEGGRSLKRRQIEASHNNVLGGAWFSIGNNRRVNTAWKMERNVVDVHTLLGGHLDWDDFVGMLETYGWAGRENLYACSVYLTSFRPNQSKAAYHINELFLWEAQATVSEEHSVEAARAIAIDWLPKDYVVSPLRLEVEGHLEAKTLETNRDLKARYPGRGMRQAEVGPGEAWAAWQETADYARWDATTKAFLREVPFEQRALPLPISDEGT